MQQLDGQIGKDLGGEVLGHDAGRLQIDLLRGLDQRIDDVGLAPLRHLGAHQPVDVVAPRRGLDGGANRLAARRAIAHHRDVHVATGGQRERPRNRRRGHQQDVGVQALVGQRAALQHAEAVLLVDHDQRQRLEGDVVLDQGVRSDDELHLPGGDLGQQPAPPGLAEPAGEQRDAEAGPEEPALERAHVLLGEDLGRRHQRHLEAVLHRHERGQRGDDGLAGSDIALQQPLHRPGPLQVGDDVAQRRPLPLGQFERQPRPRPVPQLVGHGDDVRLAHRGVLPAAQRQAGLVDEEVLEDQPALGRRGEAVERLDVAVGIGKMGQPQRRPAIRPPLARQDRRRQQFGQRRAEQPEHVVDEPAVEIRRDHAGALVDRHDAAGVQWLALAVVGEHLELGRRELQPAAAPVLGAAEQHDAQVGLDHVLEERLVRPHHLHLARGVLHQRREQLEAGPARAGQAAVQHFPQHGRRQAGLEAADRLEAAAVLVAARKAEQQVLDRSQPGLLEVGGAARADALDELERELEGIVGQRRATGRP